MVLYDLGDYSPRYRCVTRATAMLSNSRVLEPAMFSSPRKGNDPPAQLPKVAISGTRDVTDS